MTLAINSGGPTRTHDERPVATPAPAHDTLSTHGTMSAAGVQRANRALATDSRVRMFDLLRSAEGPLGVAEIAEAVGLHVNTVRAHLEVLLDAGLVTRIDEEPTRPGRPRAMFSAVEQGTPSGSGERRYQLLAEILASYLSASTDDPSAAAAEAGRGWGRYLTKRPAPFTHVDVAEATTELMTMLDDLGFGPEMASAGRVNLHQCPFLEVAEGHQDVVCAVHLGLMQGMLSELRAPLAATTLQPFVRPDLCVADLESVADVEGAAGAVPGTMRTEPPGDRPVNRETVS